MISPPLPNTVCQLFLCLLATASLETAVQPSQRCYIKRGLSHWGQLALLTTQITMPQLKILAPLQQAGLCFLAAKHPSPRQLLLGLSVEALVTAAFAAAPMPADAVGFSGDYDPSKWTTTLSPASDGSVDISNAPTDITITGPNYRQ